LTIVSKWIAWSLDNGSKIYIGKDPIVGYTNQCKLSEGLVQHLNGKRIYFLNQIYSQNEDKGGAYVWKSIEVLGINPHYKDEWTNYLKMSRLCAFDLNKSEDSMKWSWNTEDGIVTTQLAYEVITLKEYEIKKKWWYNVPWIWICL